MDTHLTVIGILLIALALIHTFFPKFFYWKKELSSLSVVNRQMMYVHSFFIAFMIFLMGLLCLTSSGELLNTRLGRRISFGLGIFWTARLLIQFVGYSSKLWKGKRFETIAHILFSLLWAYLSLIFIWIFLK